MKKKSKELEDQTEIFLEHLKEAGLRRTAQRELIVRTFLSTEEHTSLDDLSASVRKKDATVGFTTVYRTLRLLVGSGLAREVRFGDGRTYYEIHHEHEHHDHMICTECGKIIEFFSPEIEKLQDQMASNFDFKPTHHSLRMWGICSACQERKVASRPAAPGAQPRIKIKMGAK